MFTGIAEGTGKVISKTENGDGFDYQIESFLGPELKIDQSLSHDGICLTVVAIQGNIHTVQAIRETVNKTNIATWDAGKRVNLERSMPANGRFDGHIVQGHVDTTARVLHVEDAGGQLTLTFEHEADKGVTVEKGSISVNGISLTVFNSTQTTFSVGIIPYTKEHTNLGTLQVNDLVNLEFDIVGKYLKKYLQS